MLRITQGGRLWGETFFRLPIDTGYDRGSHCFKKVFIPTKIRIAGLFAFVVQEILNIKKGHILIWALGGGQTGWLIWKFKAKQTYNCNI